MHEDLARKLADPRKGIDKAETIPAKLWCKILDDLNIDIHQLTRYIQRWLDSPENQGLDPEKRSSTRGNIIKEMIRPVMTWKVLMKCICVIAPFKVDVIIRLHHDRDSKYVTEHQYTKTITGLRRETDEMQDP